LKKMKLDITHMLTKSTSPFHGIVPGNAAIPLGSVVLPNSFGETRENYRTEYIKFEVADFETSYHAILGRPAISKFNKWDQLKEQFTSNFAGAMGRSGTRMDLAMVKQ
jgi:hypothetical protein